MTDDLDDAAELLDDEPENIYPDVVAFVVDYFGPLYARQWEAAREPRWCARWWEHPEAVTRLSALWTAWEAARLEPGGLLAWLRDADANLDRLGSAGGTFGQCGPERHKLAAPLLTDPPPFSIDPPLGGSLVVSADEM